MVKNKLFLQLRMFWSKLCVNQAENVYGTLRYLYLSHLLYGICAKIFIVNQYIILLTDNKPNGGSCSVNYY